MQARRSAALHRQAGFSIVELMLVVAATVILLAVLIPTLSQARRVSYLEECTSHQVQIGQGWGLYLIDNRQRFPLVLTRPGWDYGGVRLSSVDGSASLDPFRPLSPYVPDLADASAADAFRCPADDGLAPVDEPRRAGWRTAYEAYGTSYRANHNLLDASRLGSSTVPRAVRRGELLNSPSQIVVMGDPEWYEAYEQSGRRAHWHGSRGESNMLFLDGSVRFRTVLPRGEPSPVVIEPQIRPREPMPPGGVSPMAEPRERAES